MFDNTKQKALNMSGSLMLLSTFLMVGAANLSEIFALMDEIIANTDTIVGMVILGVTVGIAMFIGAWIQKLLDKTISGKK